jgi:hypothetical protein
MNKRKSGDPGSPMDVNSSSSPKKQGVSLGPEIRDRIARDLRMVWDDVVREGVPPQFVDLLDRLDQQMAAKRLGGNEPTDQNDPRTPESKDKDRP